MSCCALPSDTTTNSSVHTGNQRRRIEQTSVVHTEDEGTACLCKPAPIHRPATQSESHYLVSRVASCGIVISNHGQAGANCLIEPELADGSRSLIGGSKVADLVHQRSHHRVNRIDELTRSTRRPASSDRTSRLRENLTNNRYLKERHVEHFRVQLPLPPCPPPRQKIPGRQRPGCNEGFSNVGLSDPLA
jgi:hypothetical protein